MVYARPLFPALTLLVSEVALHTRNASIRLYDLDRRQNNAASCACSYNSSIFATLPLKPYSYLIVQPSFLEGDSVDVNRSYANLLLRDGSFMFGYTWDHKPGFQEIKILINSSYYFDLCGGENCQKWRDISGYTNHTRLECLERYTSPFNNRSDLILVSSRDFLPQDANQSDPLLYINHHDYDDVQNGDGVWMWSESNTFDSPEIKTANLADWNVKGFGIDYCLASEWDNSKVCAVGFSPELLTGK
jgi:hypothetical protein